MRLVLLVALFASSIAINPTGYMAMGMMQGMLDDDDEWPMTEEPIKTNLRKETIPQGVCLLKESQITDEKEVSGNYILIIASYFTVLIGMLWVM